MATSPPVALPGHLIACTVTFRNFSGQRRSAVPIVHQHPKQRMSSFSFSGPGRAELDQQAARIAYLIAGFLRGTLTVPEHQELDDWVGENDRNMELFEDLTDEAQRSATLQWADSLQGYERSPRIGKLKRTLPRLRRYWPAAAACLLLAAAAWWWVYRPAPPTREPLAAVLASGRGAILTTPDGRSFPLYGDTTVYPAEGGQLYVREQTLRYVPPAGTAGPALRHSLRTLPGSTFAVVLADSTRVWLNAASRLEYPAAFPLQVRTVTLHGEAYFEVTPDPARPFRVRTGDVELQVLGTAFNVKGYTNEVTTTLVEGRLQVSGAGQQAVLLPGEQLHCPKEAPFQKRPRADVAAVLAWQQGLFVFRDAPLSEVVAELSRWYSAELAVRGNAALPVTAAIPRDLPLQRVCSILEHTGRIRIYGEGPSLIVETTSRKDSLQER